MYFVPVYMYMYICIWLWITIKKTFKKNRADDNSLVLELHTLGLNSPLFGNILKITGKISRNIPAFYRLAHNIWFTEQGTRMIESFIFSSIHI